MKKKRKSKTKKLKKKQKKRNEQIVSFIVTQKLQVIKNETLIVKTKKQQNINQLKKILKILKKQALLLRKTFDLYY